MQYNVKTIVLVFVVLAVVSRCSAECPENEEIVDCPTPCSECQYQENGCPIRVRCEKGCDCKDGYARDTNGKCIPKNQCQKSEMKCDKKNEEYSDCGTPCQKTCDNYQNEGQACITLCEKGCFCKSGYVRAAHGKCVRPRSCRKAKNKCEENEEIVSCVKPKWCNTCDIRGNCKLADDSCRFGCDCKSGYYRIHEKCQPQELCDKSNATRCGKNEFYSNCANPCNDCETRGNCQFLVCNEGCDCDPGFHRQNLPNGPCILATKCPASSTDVVCPKNEDFLDEGPVCENCGIRCLAIIKRPGCYCKSGYSRYNEHCIPSDHCPKES